MCPLQSEREAGVLVPCAATFSSWQKLAMHIRHTKGGTHGVATIPGICVQTNKCPVCEACYSSVRGARQHFKKSISVALRDQRPFHMSMFVRVRSFVPAARSPLPFSRHGKHMCSSFMCLQPLAIRRSLSLRMDFSLADLQVAGEQRPKRSRTDAIAQWPTIHIFKSWLS